MTLLTWSSPDLEAVNRTFGTSLCTTDFETRIATHPWARLVADLPPTLDLLLNSLLSRACRGLDSSERFDHLFCANNEFDFGRRGTQYVHYPWAYLPRPRTERRWYHQIPGAIRAYRWLCFRVGGMSRRRMRLNRTLVNSAFVRERFRSAWGSEAEVVHPPVAGGFPSVAWSERENGVVCIGRFHREKRQDAAIEIVAALRRRGHDLQLHLVGTPDDTAYEAELRSAITHHGDWIRVHSAIPRDELLALVARQRYGLHVMREEHFGIGVAEMQRAGCLVFVPRIGGPAEIVGNDERLLFDTDSGAVDRIDCVLRDAPLAAELRRHAARCSESFDSERFMAEIRRAVLTCHP